MRLTMIAILASLTAIPAIAQNGWNTQRFGNNTYNYGTGQNQGWYGMGQDFGNTTYRNFTGPQGQHQTCTTQRFGNQAYTNCY